MKYLLILLLPIFTACTTPQQLPAPNIETIRKITIPAELLQHCPPLKTNNPTKLDEIILEDIEFISLYGECRTRYHKLITTVQEITK